MLFIFNLKGANHCGECLGLLFQLIMSVHAENISKKLQAYGSLINHKKSIEKNEGKKEILRILSFQKKKF